MLESKVDKAVESADDKTGEDPHQNATSPASKHLTMANNVEVPAKKYQKENFNDGMKTHNFTECCRMWMCTHCSKSFASSRALKIHEVKQHENAARHVLKCGTCHEEFEHSNLLHIHMRVHHNMKVRCPRCKDIFEHPNVLKLHIKAHHSEPVCVACGVRFDHDKLLRLHMEHYHKVSSKGTAKRDLALLNQSMVSDLKKCETPELKVKVESEINTLLEGQVRSMDVRDSHMTTEEMESRRQNELHSKEPNGLASDEGDMIHSQQDSEDEALSEGSSDLGMEGSPEVEGGSPIIEGGSPRVKGESPTVEGESPGADGGGPRVGRGSPRLEGGSPRLEGRSPIVEGGSPGVEGGSPGAVEGSPRLKGGSPRLERGSPRLKGGSPELKGGSPELKGGSPWVEGRSPRFEGGNPGGDKGSCLEFDDKSSVGCGVVDSHEGQHGPEGSRHFLLSLLKSGNQRNIEQNKVTVSEVKGEAEVTTEEMDIEPVTRSFDYCRDLAQLQRSSVIVTTGSISSTGFIPQANLKDKVDDVEEPSLRLAERPDNLSDIDNSPKGSPQSHADSMSSTLSGDESADSEHTNQRARTTKRATLRCNRCPVEFYSKMEYLHHLISHQDGEDSRSSSEQSSQGQTIVRLGRHFFTKKLESSKTEETADELNVEEQRIPVEKNSSTPELDRDPNIAGTFHEAVRRDLPNAEERSRGFSIVCSMCKELFTDSRAHKLHVEKCHKKPHCGECGLAFDHKNLLKIHMNSYHSSKEVLQCYYCDESFAYRSEFLSHVTSHETKPSSSEETVRKPNNLRRTRSAIETEETEGQILPKRLRSSSLANTNRFERRQSDASANINRFEWRPSDSSALALVEGFALRQSPVDNARPCVGERSRGSDALGFPEKRDGHTQRKQEWDKEGESGFSDGRGTKTRIFLPKPQDDAKHHSAWAVLSPRDKLNHESVEQASRRLSQDYRLSAFTRYERSGHSNDFAKNLMRGYSSHMRHNSEQTEKPLGRPPPLIPVVHPRAAHTMTRQADIPLKKDGLFLRAHQPVTRTCSDNSALRPYRSPFPSRKLLEVPSPSRSATREGARECQTFTAHESINNVTKEALLNSLSLRRRASAPELGALVRQFGDIQGGSGRSPTLQAPRRSENPKSPLASPVVHLTGRARQLNEAYQPRRRHPRDFTCHHCGIYFGHKKLLKIHLDCYHGSAQELQCLPCGKNFSDRSDFLEHLMSHEGDEKMLAKPAKAPRLSEPKGERLVHEGETIIRRELNRTSVMDNTVTREAPHSREPVGSTRGTFSKETSVVGRHRPRSVMHKRETESTTEARGAVVAPQSGARTEEDDGANFCFVCGKSFNSGKQLEQHISSHAVVDKDGRYCCSLCHKTFDHHRKLEIHSRSHTGFKPHKCELCGRCFPYYSSYYYHKMTHTEDRPHKCTVCGKGFIQTRYLRSHMKTHKEQSEWNSDEDLKEEIPAQLKENDNQQMQESQMSGLGTKVKTEPVDESDCLPQGELEEQTTARILCSFKQVNNIGLSETHPRVDVKPASFDLKKSDDTELVRDVIPEETSCVGISSGPTREQASDCHQNPGSSQESVNDQVAPVETLSRVKTEQLLNGESTRNSAEPAGVPKLKKKTYQCKHCHKNFSSYSSLHVHVRIHTGQRPYSCNHCFKRFTHSSGLKRHVRCHTGEKPYPCPACPAAFADRGALKSHIRTHTGERPFICDLCKKTFTQPSSLRVHKKTVHAHEFFDDK